MERPVIKESDLCDDGGYLLNPKFVAEKMNKMFESWESASNKTEIVKKLSNGCNVLRFPFGEPGAFLILSFKYQTVSLAHLDYYIKYREPHYPCDPLITFFFANEAHAAEWEPKFGPIQIYTRCAADWTGETLRSSPLKAKEHWYFDWVTDEALAWSQLAVDEEGLKPMLASGDFNGIFSVLKRWAERR